MIKAAQICNLSGFFASRLYTSQNANVMQIIQKLQQHPFTKSATLSLLKPEEDQAHISCLATLDFKIRQDTLCIHAFFHSQDMGKKMYADALQILRLGQSIRQEIFGCALPLTQHTFTRKTYQSYKEY